MLNAIMDAQDALFIERVNEEALVIALREVLTIPQLAGTFEGRVGQLFKLLVGGGDRALPKSPQQLSLQLERLRPAMDKAGLHVELMNRDRRGRRIKVWSSLEPDPDANKRPPLGGYQ
jgi:hypothetical protein